MKKIVFVLWSFLPMMLFSQKKYYQFKKGKPVTEEKYQQVKSNPPEYQAIEETILKVEHRQDSIIYHTRWTYIPLDENGKIFDPYGGAKKILLNKKFPIHLFKDEKGMAFNTDKLVGKPTLINFWFTHCPPCIQEIPNLNALKEKYGDRVQFISITFDNPKVVERFLKKTPIYFEHITDANKEINQLEISAFPTNLILDKNGIVQFLMGSITSEEDMVIILNDLLR